MNIGVFLLACNILASVAPFEIEDPKTDGVVFGEKTSSTQLVYVNENNDEGRVNIALITGVVGTLAINVNSNNRDIIDVQQEVGSDSSQVYLTAKLLDYEMLISENINPTFPIDVIEDNNLPGIQRLTVSIVNVDDEYPTLSTSACTMKENTSIDVGSTLCVFTVTDRDGFLATMDYSEFEASNGEQDLFEFVYKNPPSDTEYSTEVYLVLKAGEVLDYETTLLYTFNVLAKDNAGHSTSPLSKVPVIVQVEDISDEPPRWGSDFRSAISIPEKKAATIEVSATDGDVGVGNTINYEITETSHAEVSINVATGEISVEPINRDTGDGKNDQIVFTVKAFEAEEPEWFIEGTITLLIEDIDDNVAKITVDGYDADINLEVEENAVDLNLNIVALDLDLGENAIYTASLTFTGDVDYSSAFTVIPSRGYESTNLALTILDPSKLDFENEDWRVISMELQTTGTKNPDNIDKRTITITLKDINDEEPVFDPDEYTVKIPENATAETILANIQATDRDAEDAELKHELIGTLANNILTIEEYGGDVTTTIDKAFDYEKQQEIIVQVRATDKGNHIKTAQLTIEVQDINDENPRMVVSSSISVEENQKAGFVLDTSISASDEDGSADLEFSIDWTKSYATKNSQILKQELFDTIKCIAVETVPNPDTKQVTAKFTIIETQLDNTPNFEVFDTLYIQLVVRDKNTEEGEGTASALIVISIQDINDNSPVFPEGTEDVKRRVTEDAAEDTVITSVVATDDDLGDKLIYSIGATDDDSRLDWVTIDSSTGSISVHYANESKKIDCDEPKRDNVKYDITVSDGIHTTSVTITVDIIDTNNKIPTMDDVTKSIDETPNGDTSANGLVVVELNPTDLDRDEAYHTVFCTWATSTSTDVTRRFDITNNTITISLQEGVDLDRETISQFNFDLNCYDDPHKQGGGNSNPINPPPKITITLNDINDNPPTIKNTKITAINESNKKDNVINLEGEDKDEANTPNSEIDFVEILEIKRFIDEGSTTPEEDPPLDLFRVETGENNQGSLIVNNDNLRGYYGYLDVTISLTDKGEPAQTNEVTVNIEVAKYNFEEPIFLYPDNVTKTVYLQTTQTANSPLIQFDGITTMPNIKATDQQDDKFLITFEIVEFSTGGDIFRLVNRGNSEAQLQVTSNKFDNAPFTLTIKGSISDDSVQASAPLTKTISVNIDFFDQANTDPVFKEDNNSDEITFNENTPDVSYQLPKADYLKEDLPGDLPVFYLIKEGDATIFDLNADSGVLTLKQELDYEATPSYNLVIQSSNSKVIKPEVVEATKFRLTVKVGDLNDESPVFDKKNYIGMAVLLQDISDRQVLTVSAIDKDTTSQDRLIYRIVSTSLSDGSSNNINDAFKINSSLGTIEATFASTADYKGFFTLNVTVEDEAPESHMDWTEVKIYLVTTANVVKFVFENDLDNVANKRDNITIALDAVFQNYSYVSNVQYPQKEDNDANDNPRTSASVFFVDTKSNAPVESNDVYKIVTNMNFYRDLRDALQEIGLTLASFASDASETSNMEETLKAWLIGVSVVLGSLCFILLIAFILKTRSLNQRIDKLSNTKFGSQESGLNRTGVVAPTTNKHAVEGSNPVYNSEVDTKDIDRRSVTSGDSDLIGVEDDEKFSYDDSLSRENVIE